LHVDDNRNPAGELGPGRVRTSPRGRSSRRSSELPTYKVVDASTRAREIAYWFRPATTPVGGAPLPVREAWIGVPLPVRHPRPVEGPEPHVGRDVADRTLRRVIPDGVVVPLVDALAALRFFGRDDAASWWQALLVERPTMQLVFRRHEGELLPPRLALMLHPELEDFELPGA
jgi:hypothetical protein